MRIYLILKEYLAAKFVRRFRDETSLRTYQQSKLKKHLKYVLKRSSFYRKLYQKQGELNLREWEKFPIIDKQIMMDNFDTLNTVGISKDDAFRVAFRAEQERQFSPTIDDITVGLSSGTSGHRGLFIVSKQESYRWAGIVLARLLPKGILHKEQIAFFLRANSNLYEATKSKQIEFKFFDLLDERSSLIDRLNDYQPTMLVAPPSMLLFLAKQVEHAKLAITPRKVISVAEVLEHQDQQYLEQVFGQTIHQVYQSTEGFLGTTCACGTLHMNEDILIIEPEYLDEERKRFFPIITDFSRKSQPIIRYRLNDILHLKAEECPCGSPFMAIEKIEGRADDIFYFRDVITGKLKPLYPDFVRRTILGSSPDILEYRVIQHDLETIIIALKTEDVKAVQKKVRQAFQALFQKLSIEPPLLHFQTYFLKPSGVKLRRVERRSFPIDEDQHI